MDTKKNSITNINNVNDFPCNSDIGRRIIASVFYDKKSIDECASVLSINSERIIQFIEALYIDNKMRRRYDFYIVEHGYRNNTMKESFVKREVFSLNENDYGNIPKESLKLGWSCPEDY